MIVFSLEPITDQCFIKKGPLKLNDKDADENIGALVIVMQSVICFQKSRKTKLMNHLKPSVTVIKAAAARKTKIP